MLAAVIVIVTGACLDVEDGSKLRQADVTG
jgi:hypothetical protein